MTRTCAVDSCGRPHLARGWCRAHYLRWQRHGDPRADVPVLDRGAASSRRAALRRVRAERGPAVGRPCGTCGAPAWCWSTPGTGDPEVFVPTCRSCLRHAAGRELMVDAARAARLYRAGVTARGIAAVLGVRTGRSCARSARTASPSDPVDVLNAAPSDPCPTPILSRIPFLTNAPPNNHINHHCDHETSQYRSPRTPAQATEQLLKDPRATTRPSS